MEIWELLPCHRNRPIETTNTHKNPIFPRVLRKNKRMGKAARWVRSLLGGKKEQRVASGDGGGGGEEKKRWSFGRSWRERGDGPAAKVVVENVWRRDYHLESEKEQSRHAIAVAAATAAAADAAVAAAQAAVAVVKLTSHGRRRKVTFGGGKEEDGAALKIQCVFRGYLARKALLALKALVKLQALVRGHIVRKQLAMNIHKIQALNRAKSRVRSRRSCTLPIKDHTRFNPESKHRRSLEMSDESKSEQHSCSFHGRRLPAISTDASQPQSQSLSGFDDSPRIVEIDPGRAKSRNRRFKQSSELQDKSAYMLLHSHLPSSWNVQECCDDCQSSTAQSTPRLLHSSAETCGATPVTPRRSGWNAPDSPNYMAKTQSFKAKVRSQSVPKLRSEPGRRDSTMETVEPTAGVAGPGTRRSCSHDREGVGFKNDTVSA